MRPAKAIEQRRQFSLLYLLGEMALIATALAASRWAVAGPAIWLEGRAVLCCIALIAGCGAAGGLCLRMAVGLIAGGIFAVASLPLLWMLISIQWR
jgi:hypothetical protein